MISREYLWDVAHKLEPGEQKTSSSRATQGTWRLKSLKAGLLLAAKYGDLSSFMLSTSIKSGMQYEELSSFVCDKWL